MSSAIIQMVTDRRLLKLKTFMNMCKDLTILSHDPKYAVAAMVITDDFREVCAIGYNGNYAGGAHERDSMETGLSGYVHGETNTLLKLSKPFELRNKLIMLCTHTPCPQCAKHIVNAGIKHVIYDAPYWDMGTATIDTFATADVKFQHFDSITEF